MKILWICGLPEEVRLKDPNGVITQIKGAAWSWILGHLPPPDDVELHCICPVRGMKKNCLEFEYLGVQWHCFRQDSNELAFLWFRFILKIRSFVRVLKPDVIHGWGGETGCGWMATWLSKNAVVSVQGLLLLLFWQYLDIAGKRQTRSIATRLNWFCERGAYRRAKILLVESEASREGLAKYYGKVGTVVPHPLRRQFLEGDLSWRINLATKPVELVFVGSLVERKGALDAVRAIARLGRRDVRLVMIGSGPLKEKIMDTVDKSGLTGNVDIFENLSSAEIVEEFRKAQFFLLPSYGDTGPTALKEAIACGLYPICYDNSGPHDLILRYNCGVLVDTGDINGLVKKISLLINDLRICLATGIKASSKVRLELSRENVWKRLIEVYQ